MNDHRNEGVVLWAAENEESSNEFSKEFSWGLSLAMGILSGLAMAASLGTIIFIRSRSSLWKKNICKFVVIMMVNEFGTSIGTSLGMSTNGSFDCWVQAFLTNYFPYCQSMWLSLTAWMLYRIIFFSKPTVLCSPYSFALCSGMPLVFALLPLTTNAFGNEDDSSGWCFLRNRKNSPKSGLTAWTIFHYSIIYLNIISYIFVLLKARIQLGTSLKTLGTQQTGAFKGIMTMTQQLIWYPIILFVAILPESLYDGIAATGSGWDLTNDPVFIYVSHLMPIASGIAMPLAFFMTNHEANIELRKILHLPIHDSDSSNLLSTSSISIGQANQSSSSCANSTSYSVSSSSTRHISTASVL